MDREKVLTIDPYILLSWTNMKLRDEFDDIYSLCEDFDIEYEDISGRLSEIGYAYKRERNQFVGV